MRTTAAVGLLAFTFYTLLSIGQAGSQEVPIPAIEDVDRTLANLAERLSPTVVAVNAMRVVDDPFDGDAPTGRDSRHIVQREPSLGSGIILTPDGIILTNEHVVHRADEVTVRLHDGLELPARLLGADERSDLAVLKVNAKDLAPGRLGDAENVRPGEWCMAIGNAFGLSNGGRLSVTVGNISATGRSLTRQLDPSETRFYGDLLQTTAVINPGNSGGPLFDIHGRVIGVNTAISTRSGANEGVGFAVPIDHRAKGIIERLRHGENIEYGFLGVLVRRPTLAERNAVGAPDRIGAIIKHVEPGGAADLAGLRPDDVIYELNGQRVRDDDHLVMLIGDLAVGERVEIKYVRDHTQRETVATTTRREIGGLGRTAGAIDWAGMTLTPLTAELRWRHGIDDSLSGMLVLRVEDSGPARDSGIRPGTVISRINGKLIDSAREFQLAVRTAGEQVAVQLDTGRSTRLYLAAGPH